MLTSVQSSSVRKLDCLLAFENGFVERLWLAALGSLVLRVLAELPFVDLLSRRATDRIIANPMLRVFSDEPKIGPTSLCLLIATLMISITKTFACGDENQSFQTVADCFAKIDMSLFERNYFASHVPAYDRVVKFSCISMSVLAPVSSHAIIPATIRLEAGLFA